VTISKDENRTSYQCINRPARTVLELQITVGTIPISLFPKAAKSKVHWWSMVSVANAVLCKGEITSI
jgi:hypothetical protein